MKFLSMLLLAGGFLMLPLVSGCAGSEKTTRTETTVAHDSVSGEPVATSTSTTTQTQTEKTAPVSAPHTGILGGALHVVGVVLAFPFKVIAGIFEFIF